MPPELEPEDAPPELDPDPPPDAPPDPEPEEPELEEAPELDPGPPSSPEPVACPELFDPQAAYRATAAGMRTSADDLLGIRIINSPPEDTRAAVWTIGTRTREPSWTTTSSSRLAGIFSTLEAWPFLFSALSGS
jgi:hypothetical protein